MKPRVAFVLLLCIFTPPVFHTQQANGQEKEQIEVTELLEFKTERERSELDRVTRVRTTQVLLLIKNVGPQVIDGPLKVVLDPLIQKAKFKDVSGIQSSDQQDEWSCLILGHAEQTQLAPGETVSIPIELVEHPQGKSRMVSSSEKMIGIGGRKSAVVHVYQLRIP